VDGSILGSDFLRHFSFSVNPAAAAIQDPSGRVFRGALSPSLSPTIMAAVPSDIQPLLAAFSGVCSSDKATPAPASGVQHHLHTVGPPVTSRFRRLDSDKLQAAKRLFSEWERDGVIRRSSSQWSSPLHMVKKKDGSWRPCGDFRRLNLATSNDKYPVPNLADFSHQLEGCCIFSTLDLRNGYLQIPLEASSVPKTAVITPFGLFEFLRMPFGLKNAGMTFQRHMDQVFNGLGFVFVYIDDILVASRSRAEHVQHLQEVFQRLHTAGLALNIKKCVFARSTVEFLGHEVAASGIRPLAAKVEALRQHPRPSTVKELQQFLGLLNFYRKFVPSAALMLAPLTESLKGSPSGATSLSWTAAMDSAFRTAKGCLSNIAELSHPIPGAELALVADASSSHVGAALHQRGSHLLPWRPLGFFSRKLDSAQRSYSAFDRELLAAFSAIRHFRFQLEGRPFQLWTDHRPLTFALGRISDAWTPRQQRQLGYIAEFTSDIIYVPGKDNVVADTLSRPPSSDTSTSETARPPQAVCLCARPLAAASSSSTSPSRPPQAVSLRVRPPAAVSSASASPVASLQSSPVFLNTGVDLAALATAQKSCPEVAAMTLLPSLRVAPFTVNGVVLVCDFSSGPPRPLLPPAFRMVAFASTHGLAHPGIRATRRLLSARWVWSGMAADAARWCRDCQFCQRAKAGRQPRAALQQMPIPLRRFSHLHIDLVGPLPRSAAGWNHLLTIIDRSSRWLEALPLSSITADAVADAFVSGWVARFGVPDHITSDRGRQFCSDVWSSLTRRLGSLHHLTTAYHPQANGMVERTHRQLKDALRARCATADWPNHLPWVLLGLRTSPKEDSNISAAELVYGAPLILPGQLPGVPEPPTPVFKEDTRAAPYRIPARRVSSPSPEEDTIPPSLRNASFVYIRHGGAKSPLAQVYNGPFQVLSRSSKYFVVDLGDRHDSISVDRLRPHSGLAEVQPASAPKRGRPPLSSVPSSQSPPGGE